MSYMALEAWEKHKLRLSIPIDIKLTSILFIHWLRADNYETLLTSYLQLYNDSLFKAFSNFNLGDEINSEIVAMRIKIWFERCQDITWLLIVDNADGNSC